MGAMSRYLFDTNACIHFRNGHPSLIARVRNLPPDSVIYTSVITLGELYYGIMRSPPQRRAKYELLLLDLLVKFADVLPITPEVAHKYGEIKAQLSAKGKPIPVNDIWIASIALVHDLTLVSSDAHFDLVEGLRREDWMAGGEES